MTRTPSAPPGWLRLCLALLTVPYLGTVEADADLWWHVRAGQWIWTAGTVPSADPWSYTAPGPWLDHEWLAHLLLGAAWATLGDGGLLLVRDVALVLGTVALGWAVWDRWPNPVGTLGLVALSVPLLAVFVNTRPQGWTYALLALLLALAGPAARGRPAAVWGMPALLVVWANLHGGFPAGWGLAGLYFLGLRVAARGAAPERRPPTLALAAVLAAPLANPYGVELLRYVAAEVGAPHPGLFEWAPPTGAVRAWGIAWVALPLLGFALAAGGPAQWSRVWPGDLVALGVSGILMLRSARFLALVVVLGPVVAATALGRLGERGAWAGLPTVAAATRSRRWALAVVAASLLAGLASERAALARYLGHVSVAPGAYPHAAVRFLARQLLGPRLATSLRWGAFALWHVGDRYRVALDGRNVTVYPPAYVDRYLLAWQSGDLPGVLGNHGADALLVETGGPLHAALAPHPDWALAFQSPVAAVYAPRTRWTGAPVILREEGGRAVFPG